MPWFFPGLLFVTFSASCFAQTLSSLLDLARGSDPTYLGAKSNLDAARSRSSQAMGALLPQISATANTNANGRTYKTRIQGSPQQDDAFNSNSAQLTLTQPLWHYANVVGLQQAEAAAQQAEHQLEGAEQELFAKLTSAWLDVLAARDSIAFTQQQASATRRQWEIAQRGLELGTSGLPQAEDTRAKYDQAEADTATAMTEFEVKLATLEQLVGTVRNFRAPRMVDAAVLSDLSAERLDTWLEALETGNPGMRAALKAFEAADAEVRKQRAGHQPTLDLVGTYGRNAQGTGGFPGQAGYTIKQNAVGLQLNIPIFSGGTQSAKVDEAVAMKEKARLDLEAARRSALLAAKQAWFGWHAAHARSRAAQQSLRAARAAHQAALRGSENGLKMELDVLVAEQQVRAAERDMFRGRYDEISNHLKLKAAVGTITAEDVTGLDKLFAVQAETPVMPAPAAPPLPVPMVPKRPELQAALR